MMARIWSTSSDNNRMNIQSKAYIILIHLFFWLELFTLVMDNSNHNHWSYTEPWEQKAKKNGTIEMQF